MVEKACPDARFVTKLITDYADEPASFTCVETGELSQAYFFKARGEPLVLRINHSEEGFRKDDYAAQHYGDPDLVIPSVRCVSRLGGFAYAISDRVEGVGLGEHDADTRQSVLPGTIAVVNSIHQKSPGGEGYGLWTSEGSALHESWHAVLLDIKNVYNWARIFKEGIMTADTYDKLFGQMHELINVCPEDVRHLIHRDCGTSNILSDGESVTGVIDWAWSNYGDPLYDVASLDVADPEIDYQQVFYDDYRQRGVVYKNYEDRLRCYRLYGGLLGLGFFAASQQASKYQEVLGWLRRFRDIEL